MRASSLGLVGSETSTIDVPDGPISAGTLHSLSDAFHREHENTYGHRSQEGEKVEIVNVRLRARGVSDDDLTPEALARASGHRPRSVAAGGDRRAFFGEGHGWVGTPVVDRSDLDRVPRGGPLIIEEYDATVVAPPGSRVFLDEASNIHIELDGRKGG